MDVQRFILQQNLTRFQHLLTEETDEKQRQTLRSLICCAQREMAALNATSLGLLKPESSYAVPLEAIIVSLNSEVISKARLLPISFSILVPVCILSTLTTPMPEQL
jgi:hypothetical protein